MDASDVGGLEMTEQEQSEVQQLRAQVAALEAELVEVQARANAAVAEWQERAYWLDRLHIDLNSLMERPGANELRLTLRAVRAGYWRLKQLKRRLSRS
jgi:outer membrane murein-binding lipoprotein Lpp